MNLHCTCGNPTFNISFEEFPSGWGEGVVHQYVISCPNCKSKRTVDISNVGHNGDTILNQPMTFEEQIEKFFVEVDGKLVHKDCIKLE